MAEVQLQNVTYAYPGAAAPVFSALNLTVPAGQAHALLGASGTGKSTLLSLLSGLLRPSAGCVKFDGKDMTRVEPAARGVAQVFQFPVLYESLSLAGNIGFPLRNRGFGAAEIDARVREIAALVGIEDLRRRPAALSLYEKQLVAIAKALIRPHIDLVLLDEPLTAVAPGIKWRLRQTLKDAQRSLGVTMVYVTHDQTEALTFADEVSVLGEAGIVQTASPQALYDEPAHKYVGHFVGSPGMNFLPAALVDPARWAADVELGFRPDWARVAQRGAAPLAGTVVGVRHQGMREGRAIGLLSLDVQGHRVHVNGFTDVAPQSEISVELARWLIFRDGLRIAADAN